MYLHTCQTRNVAKGSSCHLYSYFKMSLKHSSNDTPYRFINSKLKATDSGTPENKCHGNEVMS